MEKFSNAASEAQEIIGKGLLDALSILGGQGVADIDAATTSMNKLATATSEVIVGQASAFSKLGNTKAGGFLKSVVNFGAAYLSEVLGITASRELGRAAMNPATGASTLDNYNMTANSKAAAAARAKAEADAKKRAKELLAAQTKNTAELKKQAALKKAGSIFDLEQIQIIAALQGNLSKDEETRLKAQLALLNGNATVATSLTKQILMSQDATGNLYKLWQTLPDAKNPFAYLEEWLKAFQGKLNATQFPVPVSGISVGTGQGGSVAENYRLDQIKTNVAPMPSTADIARLAAPMSSGSSTIGDYLNVVLQVDGKTIASALQDTSMSGIPSAINRTYGSFAGR
jgi:hypothetical protein